MKILFTKTGIEAEVFAKMKTGFSFVFQDFIKINLLDVAKFDVSAKALLFTSTNGVNSFVKNGFKFNQNKIFSVGKKTAQLLEKFGQTSENFENSEMLKNYLGENFQGKILHFCSDIALNITPENTEIQRVICYKTNLLYPAVTQDFDAVCFFSPSGVRSFAKFNSFIGKKIFSIGEITTAELQKSTQEEIITSPKNNLDDLLQLIRKCG